LPPPRMIQSPKGGAPRWVWILLLVIALLAGTGGGLFIGLKREAPVIEPVTQEDPKLHEEIARKLGEARIAVGEGDWLLARSLFEEVRELDPENPDALASLPLIDRRLDEAEGSIVVTTEPPGAEVSIPGAGVFQSPATISGLPLGEHQVTIAMEGYESVERKISISSESPVVMDSIELARSAGQLEVVSDPVGAEYKLLKTIKNDQKELVQIGSTPALIEKLDPGEYEVLFAVEGWPEYSETVQVENNRNASVSAVFSQGGLSVKSDPTGAEVWIENEEGVPELRGTTPVSVRDLPVGRQKVELRYQDWPPITRSVEIVQGVTEKMEFSWERAWVKFTSDPPGVPVFKEGKRLGDGRQVTPFEVEFLEGDYAFRAQHPQLGVVEEKIYVDADAGSAEVAFRFPYGSVRLTSEPSGAAVIANGTPLGRTPLQLPVLPPGSYTYELRKDQYRSSSVSGVLEPGGSLNFTASLIYDPQPTTSRSFTNGLGQKMVWIAELGGWVAAYETTQAQYERITGKNPSYFPAPNHPVESVNWYDAARFCEALTVQERGAGRIPEGFRYRLPTDSEWSRFVGGQKLDGAVTSLFELKKSTAPVGSLKANEFGIYDARGNVWEWVSDWYSQTIVRRIRKDGATPNTDWVGTDRKVLRGGAWNRSDQYDLAVGNRMAARPSAEDRYDVGFRVVLMQD